MSLPSLSPVVKQRINSPPFRQGHGFIGSVVDGANTTTRSVTILDDAFSDKSGDAVSTPVRSKNIRSNATVDTETFSESGSTAYKTDFSMYRAPYIPILCDPQPTTAAERYYAKKREQQERYEATLLERQEALRGSNKTAAGRGPTHRTPLGRAPTPTGNPRSLPPISLPATSKCVAEDELADDMEIERLKNRLFTLDKERGLKAHDLTLINVDRIDRDIKREEHFRRAFKTPDQLEAERQETRRKALELDIDKLVSEEASARDDEAEEEALEYQYQLYTLHLRMVSISVRAVIQERNRSNMHVKLIEEERHRKVASTQQMLAGCEQEAEFGTGRKGTEREEALARRVLLTQFDSSLEIHHAAAVKREHEMAARLAQEEAARLDAIRRTQQQEEDDAVNALNEKMLQIDRKYAKLMEERPRR